MTSSILGIVWSALLCQYQFKHACIGIRMFLNNTQPEGSLKALPGNRKSLIWVKQTVASSTYIFYHLVKAPEHHRLIMNKWLIVSDIGLLLKITLKYMGSTLCLRAWAFPTKASTDDTFSGSWRFSTTVLMAFITLRAWCRSWLLRSISSGSSMSWNWLKYCLADGKLTKNLKRQT